MRIAIMQPYFIPYAGYFRLFAAADLFIVYDCVQFPRRGWVHRNQLTTLQGELDWLTLPIAKCSQATKIVNLNFTHDVIERLDHQLNKFPIFKTTRFLQNEMKHAITDFSSSPANYIVNLLKLCCAQLNIHFNIILSSSLTLPDDLKGQERIIAIAKHFNADTYINAPGGKELYEEKIFKQHGLNLKFLPPFNGCYASILSRLLTEELVSLRKEILSQLI